MVRVCCLLAALCLAPVGGCAPKAPPSADARHNAQVETFDYVWQRVGESFPDPEMNGVDWAAVRDELRPQALAASSADELRPVLLEMLQRIGVSHLAILPGRVYRPTLGEDSGPRGHLGFDAGLVEGAVHILTVRPDGPAAAAGLQPGDRIVSIADTELDSILRTFEEADGPRRPAAAVGSLMRELIHQPLRGPCTVVVDRNEERLSLAVQPGPLHGEVFKMGELPATLVETVSSVDRGSDGEQPPVLVVRFSMFAVPSALAVKRAVIDARAQDVEAAIIDLRGNPGGMLDVARGLAGHFVARRSASLGTFTTREAALDLSIRPRVSTERLDGPLVVLVDGRSASSSEVLAGGLQDLGRATVVGEQSSGLALMSAFESLPNGDRMQFVFADLETPSGRRLEGEGVTPDVVVAPTADALRAGHDPVLEAGLATVRAGLTPPPPSEASP